MTNGVRPVPGYLAEDDCRLDDLIEVVSEKTDLADYPHASTVEQNVLMYDSARLREDVASAEGRWDAQAELVRALHDGPGIVVFTGAFGDLSVVDRAHPAGRGRALGHAGRDRPDDVPAALPEVPARLPGRGTARVRRLLRAQPRPVAAQQGRRGVLQPCPVPCGWRQPHHRHQPD